MVTATFRFFGELNAFLPRARRGRSFTSACARQATVKHMIEALGVPHTEVEALLVNGKESPFGRVLCEGDQVEVHAHWVPAAPRPARAAGLPVVLRERPRERMRFVADAHLGGLARLLRMAGFDSLYDNGYHDDAVEALAVGQDRIVLTRDLELLKRREIVHGCYIHPLQPAQQLRALFARLDLGSSARPFTLCLHCNAPLRAVDKAGVLDRLPESVRTLHDSFTTCDSCARVYWRGSHYQRMAALLASIGTSDQAPPAIGAGVESSDQSDHPTRT